MRINPLAWLKRLLKGGTSEPARAPLLRHLYDLRHLSAAKVIPSDEALGIQRFGPGVCFIKPCAHRDAPRAFSYRVFETDLSLALPTRCPDCMQALLEAVCERCAACDRAIGIGFQVAVAWIDAPHPYTHLECAESPLLYCGHWGVGQLASLHDMNNDIPTGVATMLAHAINEAERQAEEALKKPNDPDDEGNGGANEKN